MNIICSDKTGTLTEGTVKLQSSLDIYGNENQEVALSAFLNASFETGFVNAIDQSIRENLNFNLSGFEKKTKYPMTFNEKDSVF